MREREKENMIYFLRERNRESGCLTDRFTVGWIESKLDDNCKHKKRNLA